MAEPPIPTRRPVPPDALARLAAAMLRAALTVPPAARAPSEATEDDAEPPPSRARGARGQGSLDDTPAGLCRQAAGEGQDG